MKAAEFDRRFDAGEDITEAVDWRKARRPNADGAKADSGAQSAIQRKEEKQ
ncbi:hypothetical protein M728_001069 [Ensifer sp. WSM1721]